MALLHLLLFRPLAAAPTPTQLPNGTPLITTSDGVRLYTKISGQGLPCVFVHGGPGAWSGMPEALAGPSLEDRLQMIWMDSGVAAAPRMPPTTITPSTGWCRTWKSCASSWAWKAGS